MGGSYTLFPDKIILFRKLTNNNVKLLKSREISFSQENVLVLPYDGRLTEFEDACCVLLRGSKFTTSRYRVNRINRYQVSRAQVEKENKNTVAYYQKTERVCARIYIYTYYFVYFNSVYCCIANDGMKAEQGNDRTGRPLLGQTNAFEN